LNVKDEDRFLKLILDLSEDEPNKKILLNRIKFHAVSSDLMKMFLSNFSLMILILIYLSNSKQGFTTNIFLIMMNQNYPE
jgi:hypothetical protein